MPSFNKSTYTEIIDDVLADLNIETDQTLNRKTIQSWILDAEKILCDKLQIRDSWNLSIKTNQSEYIFQDRPPITNASNATPVVVTSTSHGLSNDTFIVVSDVQGNTTPNGNKIVKNVSTDTFEVNDYSIVSGVSNATPIQITTTEPHPFSNGDTITLSGVLGNTAANGTFVITFIDAKNFSLNSSIGNGVYTTGGIAVKQTSGNGTYLSGGRYWKTDEIPTRIKEIQEGTVLINNIIFPIKVVSMQKMNQIKEANFYPFPYFSGVLPPYIISEWTTNGIRSLKAYPDPTTNITITLYGYVKITPRLYQGDDEGSTIHLTTDYDEAIKRYVSFKYSRYKEKKSEGNDYLLFKEEVKSLQNSFPFHFEKIITYK